MSKKSSVRFLNEFKSAFSDIHTDQIRKLLHTTLEPSCLQTCSSKLLNLISARNTVDVFSEIKSSNQSINDLFSNPAFFPYVIATSPLMVDFFLNLMDREEIDTSHVLSVCHTLGPPLNYAIICQDIELIVPLINHGAKVTQTVPGYPSPMTLARAIGSLPPKNMPKPLLFFDPKLGIRSLGGPEFKIEFNANLAETPLVGASCAAFFIENGFLMEEDFNHLAVKDKSREALSKVCIARCGHNLGLGVFAKEDISVGEHLGHYTGLIDKEKESCKYSVPLFDQYFVNSEENRNLGSFFNHDDNANVEISVYVKDGLPYCGVFAKCNVPKGRQLCLSYQDDWFSKRGIEKISILASVEKELPGWHPELLG